MDFSHYLHTSIPDKRKLIESGFTESGGVFILKKNIPDLNFYALIKISEQNISVNVFDSQTEDRYALFDVVSATGSFIGELRAKVQQIMDNIHNTCFECRDVKENYVKYLLENFTCRQDFPWNDSPEYSVFRCENEKWFALLMNISFKCLGFDSEEKVWVVNLKADPEKISEIVDGKTVFPAYHMNKKYWITVLLTSVADFNQICTLTEESYGLVAVKKSNTGKSNRKKQS